MTGVQTCALPILIFEGTSEGTLARGVGHLMGSALPGEMGNLVLAGHRDTFFRELRAIRDGDTVDVGASQGELAVSVAESARA